MIVCSNATNLVKFNTFSSERSSKRFVEENFPYLMKFLKIASLFDFKHSRIDTDFTLVSGVLIISLSCLMVEIQVEAALNVS